MSKQFVHWKTESDPFVLNLDPGFKPLRGHYVELEYKTFEFKGGEPHFQITSNVTYFGRLTITQRYNSINDLFLIVMAVDAARRMGFDTIDLVLPYFPAARQDRVCNVGEPLTIKLMADIINGCGFNKVTILSPHSEVTPALLNKVVVLDELEYVENVVSMNKDGHHFNIVCPDAGAGKRVNKIVQHLSAQNGYIKFNLIRCEKVRDVKDGSIKEFFVDSDDLGGYPTLIVDDLVCGGLTFKGLGDKLKQKNCGKLMLYVTHADYVGGLQSMVEYFDHVYVTNSKRNWQDFHYTFDNKLTCFEINL